MGRLGVVGLRVLGWPLTGLITDAPLATILGAGVVVGTVVWRAWPSRTDRAERPAVRWLGLGLAWTTVALARRRPQPGDRRPRPSERPLPRVRRPDGLRARRGRLRGAAGEPEADGPGRHGPGQRGRVLADAGPLGRGSAGACGRRARDRRRPGRLEPRPSACARRRRRGLASRSIGGEPDRGRDGGEPLILSSLPVFKSDEAVRFPLVRAGVEVDVGRSAPARSAPARAAPARSAPAQRGPG